MTVIMARPTLEYGPLLAAVLAQGPAPVFADAVVPALWSASLRYGLDPLAVVAQSAHETGWGAFARLVKPWHRNTCGLKVRDLAAVMGVLGTTTSEHVLCHAQFGTWAEGAEAHAQHLRAYCQVPFDALVVDPRYDVARRVIAANRRPPCVTLRDLDPWAGHEGYGDSLELVADRLLRAAGG